MGTGRGFNQSQVANGFFPAADWVGPEEALDLAEQARKEQAELADHNHSWYMAWAYNRIETFLSSPQVERQERFFQYCRANGFMV